MLACWFCFILYYLVMCFCILVHDYTLWFIGSPCYNVSYYNYNSIWPYYIVIYYIKRNEVSIILKQTVIALSVIFHIKKDQLHFILKGTVDCHTKRNSWLSYYKPVFCLMLTLVCDVCLHFITWAASVSRMVNWFLIVHLVKMSYMHGYS